MGMVEQLDPRREDPALQNMVVIGHSQGGLLAKMTADDSGDVLWRAISDEHFDDMQADPAVKNLARRLLFLSRSNWSSGSFS